MPPPVLAAVATLTGSGNCSRRGDGAYASGSRAAAGYASAALRYTLRFAPIPHRLLFPSPHAINPGAHPPAPRYGCGVPLG